MKSRLRWMDESGIDVAVLTNNTQVLTKSVQGKDDFGLTTWIRWNDELAEVERQHPDRFVASPSIPIFDAKTALNELERVVSTNEAKAVIIQPLKWRIDQGYLDPFYEKLNDLRLPLFFHPVNTDLVVDKAVDEMRGVYGFAFNTTIALSCFMTSGILDKYPHLKLVIPHLGGALPFLLGRLDLKYDTGNYQASRPPSEYFGNFYFDVVAYSKKAV
ncbi:MAG: amidohydrolase family protein, partial [Thaumarchaeota archaeon]|nr:amidohydrolase family protein [Nitrososphaerota archaeon]